MLGYIFHSIKRPGKEFITAYMELNVACIYESSDEKNILDPGIQSLLPGNKICGSAITCKVEPGDNLLVHKAITLSEPGDILIVDGGGDIGSALWGNNMSHAAQAKGIAGVIIDGAVRDTADIRSIKLSCMVVVE